MRSKSISFWLLALFFTVILASCGGGGGSSSPSGGTNPPATGIASAGVMEGQITAFGSIVVNGRTLTTTGATLRMRDDGTEIQLQNEAEIRNRLKEGEVVRVRGTFDDRTGTATEIEFRDRMEALVDDKGVDFVTVLGQRVFVDDKTKIFDASGNSATFASLSLNDRLEVSGLPDDRGGLRATFLMKKASAGEVEIKGFVLSLTGNTFTLGLTKNATSSITVNFAGAVLPNGAPVVGDFVEVKSTTGIVGGVLTATRVEKEDEIEPAQNEKFRIEGLVTSGTADDFFVNGTRRVQTNASTVFKRGTRADFALNLEVEVEGNIVGEILVATEVEFEDSIKVDANVQAVTTTSATTGQITLQGFPATKLVIVSSFTEIKDGGSTLSLASIASGNELEIRGSLDSNGNIVASRIDRRSVNPATRVFIQGPVTAKAPSSSLTIIGLSINTSAAEFRTANDTPMDSISFFNAITLNVTVVKVRWDAFTSVTNPVNRAELEEAS